MNIIFTGDLVIDSENKKIDFGRKLQSLIDSSDVVCCNLEGPITRKNRSIKKIGPVIKQNSDMASYIRDKGFNLCALANNHIMDYGLDGLKETIDAIENERISHVGAGANYEEALKPFIYKKDDIEVCIINVAENGFGAIVGEQREGYLYFGNERFEDDLSFFCAEYKNVILIVHAGCEMFSYPLPEIRNLYKRFIDIGVSLVIGHHPHVPQGYERYNNGIIYYSLGDFIFRYNNEVDINSKKTYIIATKIDESGIKTGAISLSVNDNVMEIDCVGGQNEIDRLSVLLNNKQDYYREVNKHCVELYNNVYVKYYGYLRYLTTIYNVIFRRKNLYNSWLFHNISIETHYWVCRRALNNINKLY